MQRRHFPLIGLVVTVAAGLWACGFDSIKGQLPSKDAGAGTGGEAATTSGGDGGGVGGGVGSGAAAGYACSWAKDFNGGGDQELAGLAVDSQGGLFLTGSYTGTLDLGAGPLPGDATSGRNAFVAALTSTGRVVWSKGFGESNDQSGAAIVATDGDLFVTGRFRTAINLGCPAGPMTTKDVVNPQNPPDPANDDVYIARLSKANGDCAASYQYTLTPTDRSNALAVEGDSVIMAGTISAKQTMVVGHYGSAQLDNRGEILYASGIIDPEALVLRNGTAYVAGTFSGSAKIDPAGAMPPLMGDSDGDAWLASLDYLAFPFKTKWAKGYSQAGVHQIRGMVFGAIQSEDSLLVAGDFGARMDFGCGAVTASEGGRHAFVARLRTDGSCAWSHAIGEGPSQTGAAVALDDIHGAVLVAGGFQGELTSGGQRLTNAENVDHVYLSRLDKTGASQWSAAYGTSGQQEVRALIVRGSSVYLAGNYRKGSLSFGAGCVLNNTGDTQKLFIARLDPVGF